MELTSQKYWEAYYETSPETKDAIEKVCGRYDYFWDLFVSKCKYTPKTILEIGAFPGRYLAYLSSRYQLEGSGIDFNPDYEKVRRSMNAMGVSHYRYICEDFLKHQPEPSYDLVFSNGFIEHFTNFDEILDKHVSYLNNGGAIMIMIPNKRFIRSVYGNLVDRDNQKAHNLKSMDLIVFENFAKRNGLTIDYLGYEGGFPYKTHGKLNFMQKVIYHTTRFVATRANSYIKRHPSKWWSSAIICICSDQRTS